MDNELMEVLKNLIEKAEDVIYHTVSCQQPRWLKVREAEVDALEDAIDRAHEWIVNHPE